MTRILRAANHRDGRKGFQKYWGAQMRILELERQMRRAVARSSPHMTSSRLYRFEHALARIGLIVFVANLVFWFIAGIGVVTDMLYHLVRT
jgi:hypothetical protein